MARSGDPFSDRMNSMAKYVVSSTLTDPEWNNTTVISRDPNLSNRREEPVQDIVQYGFGRPAVLRPARARPARRAAAVGPPAVRRPRRDDLMFRPTATAQLELAGALALNAGIVILTYRVPAGG